MFRIKTVNYIVESLEESLQFDAFALTNDADVWLD